MHLKSKFAHLLIRKNTGLLLTAFLLFSLGLTVFLAGKSQDIRNRAAAPKIQQRKAPQPPSYVQNQIIIKFASTAPDLSVKTAEISTGVDLDKGPVRFDDINQATLPESIQFLHGKHPISTISKVFRSPKRSLQSISELAKVYTITFSNAVRVDNVIKDILGRKDIVYAEPNYIYTKLDVPNDPYYLDTYPNAVGNRDLKWNPTYDYQWNVKKINPISAWSKSTNPIVVAVVDTGVDYTHIELGGCTLLQVNSNQCASVVPGYDFVNSDTDPRDDNGHGTHVSGIIAALTNNGEGIASVFGLTNNVKIMPMKGLDAYGSGYLDTLANAVYQAAVNGAKVINMSYGVNMPYQQESQTEKTALEEAYALGATLVASAGNSRSRVEYGFWPANNDKVIAVGSTEETDTLSGFSNYGEKIDVVAPGGNYGYNLLSLNAHNPANPSLYLNLGGKPVGNGYLLLSGTSMASPAVSGLAALLKSMNPTFTPAKIRDVMDATADDLGDASFDIKYGYGRINVSATVENALIIKAPPRAKITSPQFNDTKVYNSSIQIVGSATGDDFNGYTLEWSNDQQKTWSTQYIDLPGDGSQPITNGALGTWNLGQSPAPGKYTFRLMVSANGKSAFSTSTFSFDPSLARIIDVPCPYPNEESSPLVTDLDGDGPMEILSVCYGKLYVYSRDGSLKYTKQAWTALPAADDLDPAYPGKEMIVVQDYYLDASVTRWVIMAWHADGTPVAGNWPRTIEKTPGIIKNVPDRLIIADINGDSAKDVLIFENASDLSGSGRYHGSYVYALDGRGNDVAGFVPFNTPRMNTSYGGSFHSERFVGDVTGDGKAEIINREMFDLSVFDGAGTFIWKYEDENLGPIAVGDIDRDGKKEIIASIQNGTITQFKWNGSTFSSAQLYQLPNASYTYGINRITFTQDVLQGKPELLLELHSVVGNEGFFKYVLLSSDGQIVGAFPGTNGIQFPDSLNAQLQEYPWIYDATINFIPTNVVSMGINGQTYFGYEAMTFRDDASFHMPDTYLEMFSLNGNTVSRLSGFPKEIRTQWDYCYWTCQTTYLTPVIVDLDGSGHASVVSSVNIPEWPYGFSIYIYSLPSQLGSQIWPQYLYNTQRTNVFQAVTTAPVPSVTPSPTPSATAINVVADFQRSVTKGISPLTVTFTNRSSIILPPYDATYIWDFGDGQKLTTQSNKQNPTNKVKHTYTLKKQDGNAKVFSVTLTVTDTTGHTDKKTRRVKVFRTSTLMNTDSSVVD